MTPLRERMIEDMQLRNLTAQTQRSYLQCVSLLARHFRKSPEELGPAEIRAYQLYLAQEKQLSARSMGGRGGRHPLCLQSYAQTAMERR
jgi:integrase/recombinase XerD